MREVKNRKRVHFRMLWEAGAILLLSGVLGILVNQTRSDGLPLHGDWSPEAQLTLESGESMVISLKEAERLFSSGKALFVDARPAELYEKGHIQGAQNLPWEEFDQYFHEVMSGVPPEKVIIAYCDGEACALSKDVARELFFRGYDHIKVLVNGWSRWLESGLPTSRGSGEASGIGDESHG